MMWQWGYCKKQSGLGMRVDEVDGNVVLTASRTTPAPGDYIQRGEGVALVLWDQAVDAWRRGGRQWKA